MMSSSTGRSRPLRIFQLIKGLGRGGAETLLLDGPRSSDPQRFQYGFGYFLPHKDALVPDLARHFETVRCFPARSPGAMMAQVVAVAAELRRFRADVLHCHLPLAGVVGRLAGAMARVPVVYTEHNVLERYHRATRLAAKASWRLQRSVVAVSGDVAASIARNIGDAVPVRVVLNGVSLDRFDPEVSDRAALRAQLGIAEDAPVVGSVAVFRVQKRLDLWLKVAKETSIAVPEARFLLVGDGPLRADVERQIQELGLAHRVVLPGLQSDVRPYLRAMDLYLMTSDFEGVPIALLEAMAMQRATVLTDAGGIPEVVASGQHGEIRKRGDVDGLVAATCQLLCSAERRRAYGQAARERVASHFSTARMMRELEEVYEHAASR